MVLLCPRPVWVNKPEVLWNVHTGKSRQGTPIPRPLCPSYSIIPCPTLNKERARIFEFSGIRKQSCSNYAGATVECKQTPLAQHEVQHEVQHEAPNKGDKWQQGQPTGWSHWDSRPLRFQPRRVKKEISETIKIPTWQWRSSTHWNSALIVELCNNPRLNVVGLRHAHCVDFYTVVGRFNIYKVLTQAYNLLESQKQTLTRRTTVKWNI